jgi:hypothetical protein
VKHKEQVTQVKTFYRMSKNSESALCGHSFSSRLKLVWYWPIPGV